MNSVVTIPRSSVARWEVVAAGDPSTIGKIRGIIPLGASFELSAVTAADGTAASGLIGLVIPNRIDVPMEGFTLDAASVGSVIALGQ